MKALQFTLSKSRLAWAWGLGRVWEGAYLSPLGPTRLVNVDPSSLPGEEWVLVRTALAGICGSDCKQVYLRGARDNPLTGLISFPHVLGHEAVGTVESVGPRVRAVEPGTRVVLNPWLPCRPRGVDPPCPQCQAGRYPLCANFTRGPLAPGLHTGNCASVGGGFAPLFAAHESQCVPLPPEVTWEQGVLADPFAVSLHSLVNWPPPERGTAMVYGCGTLGLMAVAALSALWPSVRVVAVARWPQQAELARRLGAAEVLAPGPASALVEAIAGLVGAEPVRPWSGLPWLLHGVDVVYDTVGSAETLEVGVRVTSPRGRVVVSGVEPPRRFEWTPLYFKEVAIVGSNAFGVEEVEGRRAHAMEHYLELVRSRRLDLTPLITHRYPLDRFREAFAACRHRGVSGAVKVLFTFDPAATGASRN